jgi:hypothetical protein
MSNYYVYAHYTKTTKELFYIGKGKNNRAYSEQGRSNYWKRVVKKHGLEVIILIDELESKEADNLEIIAISLHSPRCNFTKGGTGGNTTEKYNEIRMAEYKKKCSKSKKDWWNSKDENFKKEHTKPANRAVSKMWKNMDPEQKSNEQKRRNSLKKRKKVKCLNTNKIYNTVEEAAKDLKISYKQGIYNQINGYKKHIQGYKFTYVL